MQSFEPVRLQAINILRERLNQRRGKGFPVPTDSNRIRAATRIQACTRGHQARKQLSEAADLKQSGRPIRMQAINLLKQRLHEQRKGSVEKLVFQQETDVDTNEVPCHVALEIEFGSEEGLSSQAHTRKRSPSVQAAGTTLVCSFDLDNAINPEDSVYLEEPEGAEKAASRPSVEARVPCTSDTRDMFADDDLQTTYSLSVG